MKFERNNCSNELLIALYQQILKPRMIEANGFRVLAKRLYLLDLLWL